MVLAVAVVGGCCCRLCRLVVVEVSGVVGCC
jgi:hypothetical protein